MICATLPSTTFRQASWSLRSRRPVMFSRVIERLQGASFRANAAAILAELEPQIYQGIKGKISLLVDDQEDGLVDETINAIYLVAPLDREFVDGLIAEGDRLDLLYLESCGFPMGWDEWGEMSNNPGGCDDSMGLFIFATGLRIDDLGALANGNEYFGWNLPEDIDFDSYEGPDWEKFEQLLDKNNLGCFKHAIDVCGYSTGNPYFDFNLYDENEIPNLPPFSLEGVHKMRQFWQESPPILADYQKAEHMFNDDRSLARKILKLWLKACKKKTRVRSDGRYDRGQTLAEMWGDEEPERVIDTFYGPLDGRDEEDEECCTQ